MKKPVVIVVLGIINVSLAGLGLLGAGWGLASIFIMPRLNPALEGVYTGQILVLSIGVIAFGVLTKGLMAVSGVGLIRGRRWGKSVGVVWAWLSMLYGSAAAVINAVIVSPAVMDATLQNMAGQGPSGPATANAMQSMQLVTVVLGLLVGLAMALGYQVTFLILVARPGVKTYFDRAGDTGLGMHD